MSNTFELNAVVRDAADQGKGASRRLRHANRLPAILYGANKTPIALSLCHNETSKALNNEAFYSTILTINMGEQQEQAVLKAVQRHPFKPRIMHLDFQRIIASEKITISVPLHFIGEDSAPGVKLSGGLVSKLITEIEVKCLPADLPEFLTADVSKLELEHALHLSDLTIPAKVELVALSHGRDLPVANIHLPRSALADDSATDAAAGDADKADDKKDSK